MLCMMRVSLVVWMCVVWISVGAVWVVVFCVYLIELWMNVMSPPPLSAVRSVLSVV